jgi:hypothetical protein
MLASTTPAATTHTFRPNAVVGVILAVWLGAVVLLSATGQFFTEVGQPPLALLTAVLLPIGVFGLAYASSAAVRDFVRASDPAFLTTLQSWRILGGTFLVLFTFGMLPAAFALPAGLGDVAIGVTAPFIARAMVERGPARAGRLFVVWQLLGILDLVVAVGVGASLRTFPGLTEATANSGQMVTLSQLPLSLIPGFAVPLFVILHLASLAQYRARTRGAEGRM